MRISWLLPLLAAVVSPAQDKKAPEEAPPAAKKAAPRVFTEFPVPDVAPLDVEKVSREAIVTLIALQEGDDDDQWPYQGVYREDRSPSPVGYRVGGTSIAILGLLSVPGYRTDTARQDVVARGVRFVLKTLELPRMEEDFVGTYDVRGWGHVYGLLMLQALQEAKAVPPDLAEQVAAKEKWLVQVLCDSAIPKTGGWNYSRPAGYKAAGNGASPFMTAPALQALFLAKARGHAVPDAVITQALDALERARAKPGGYAYSTPAKSMNQVEEAQLPRGDRTPGSAARAAACEVTLLLAGRGDLQRLERAVDLFFAHWDDLAVRKSQTGTHIPPYGIAPYYFLYGHVYAAQAIEFVPDEQKREALRGKMRAMLAKSREADGSWNDRQFERSGGYGTAMALLAMHMPRLPKMPTWTPSGEPAKASAPSQDAGAGK